MQTLQRADPIHYNTVGRGELNALGTGDLAIEGQIRVGGSVYNSDGQFDHIPFMLSGQSISSVEQSISFTGRPYSGLGSQADGTVTYFRDCRSSGEAKPAPLATASSPEGSMYAEMFLNSARAFLVVSISGSGQERDETFDFGWRNLCLHRLRICIHF
jgi:hypothetical protein